MLKAIIKQIRIKVRVWKTSYAFSSLYLRLQDMTVYLCIKLQVHNM